MPCSRQRADTNSRLSIEVQGLGPWRGLGQRPNLACFIGQWFGCWVRPTHNTNPAKRVRAWAQSRCRCHTLTNARGRFPTCAAYPVSSKSRWLRAPATNDPIIPPEPRFPAQGAAVKCFCPLDPNSRAVVCQIHERCLNVGRTGVADGRPRWAYQRDDDQQRHHLRCWIDGLLGARRCHRTDRSVRRLERSCGRAP